MTPESLWNMVSRETREQLLVASGVNNRKYLCAHCPSSGLLPYCHKQGCEPCRRDGSPFNVEGVTRIIDEPHAYILMDSDFYDVPEEIRATIIDILKSI